MDIESDTSYNDSNEKTKNSTERGGWNNHFEFFLTSLGLAVGLGNIWRFPFIAFQHGGGTFLIPYILMLLFVGLPTYFMEMLLGQYAGLSCTKIYERMFPGLKGLGYGVIFIPILIDIYYTIVMAYGFFYLFAGFTSDLPWTHCGHDYNTVTCFSISDAKNCSVETTFWNNSCTEIDVFCNEYDFHGANNATHCSNGSKWLDFQTIAPKVSASEEYFYRYTLGLDLYQNEMTNSWENWGSPRWPLIGCLALSWFLVCLSLIKGVTSYGKVAYFITLFPYVVLTILLGYVATLDGFEDGIKFYLTPDWNKLTETVVWKDAATQIFFSLAVGVGSQLLLSSYNSFDTNTQRDTILVAICNSLTSIYAGFVVFGVIGYIAKVKGQSFEDSVQGGPGLTFILYPEAVSAMAISPLFSFLFFLMLILLAMSSICGSYEAVISSLLDQFPQLRPKRTLIMIGSSTIMFLLGTPMLFDSGFLLFNLMDMKVSNSILIMAFIEVITVSWFYGVDQLFENIAEMKIPMPFFMKVYWQICWVVITPLIMIILLTSSFYEHQPIKLFNYLYPDIIQILGWILELSSFLLFFIVSSYFVYKKYKRGQDVSFLKLGPNMMQSDKWGPRKDRPQNEQVTGIHNETFEEI